MSELNPEIKPNIILDIESGSLVEANRAIATPTSSDVPGNFEIVEETPPDLLKESLLESPTRAMKPEADVIGDDEENEEDEED